MGPLGGTRPCSAAVNRLLDSYGDAENLRDQMIITGLLEHEMHMAGAIRMSVELLQKLSNGAIVRNRVRHRLDGLEPERTVVLAFYYDSSIWPVPIGILDIIMAR